MPRLCSAPSSSSAPRRLALGVLLSLTLPAGSARAYVCTSVKNAGTQLTQAWNQRCIPYTIDRRGTLFSGAERRMLIAQSFRVWSSNACTDLEFMDMGYTNQGAKFDSANPASNENVIMAVETAEDYRAFPQDGLLAITLTSYSTETGEIFDADILFNAVNFSFEDLTNTAACTSGSRAYDLRNTLIHEMGHLIGFDHGPDVESTMYASATTCETRKRDLTTDDIHGVCTVYPKGQPAHACRPPASYDGSRGFPAAFRCQCARLSGGSTEACDGEASSGCTCVVGAETADRSEAALGGAASGEGARDGAVRSGWRGASTLLGGALALGLLAWTRARRGPRRP